MKKLLIILTFILASTVINAQKLIRAEYFIDTDPGGGKGVIIPGVIKADSISLQNISIPTTGLSEGSHVLGLRVRDSLGSWSPTYFSPFSILANGSSLSLANNSKLIRAEYFIDTDPGGGKGIVIPGVLKADSISIQNVAVSIAGLAEGSHVLGLRVRDSLGYLSPTYFSAFSILANGSSLSVANNSKLIRAEYFIDTDPGGGKGIVIPSILKEDSISIKNLAVSTTGLTEGAHVIGLRVRDSLGYWSPTFFSPFSILGNGGSLSIANNSKLILAEYFIDADPGGGKGVIIPGILKADSISIQNVAVPTVGLTEGSHVLGLRVRDSSGYWSPTYFSPFSILKGGGIGDTSKLNLVYGEYFFGSKDPGNGLATSFKVLPEKSDQWSVMDLGIPIPDTLGYSLDNYLTFRIKQENGFWTSNQTVKFDVCSSVTAAPSVPDATICGGSGSTTLKASGYPLKKYAWFTNSFEKSSPYLIKSSATGNLTDTTFNANLSSNQKYWIAAINPIGSNCPYGLRDTSKVEVVQALQAPTVVNQQRCGPGKLTFTATGAPLGGTYRWFSSDSTNRLLFQGNPFFTDSLTKSQFFIVNTVSNGGKCQSLANKKPVATINICTPQSITFPQLNDIVFGTDNFVKLMASSGSKLSVIYSIIAGPARLSNDTLIPTGIGEISVLAEQPGDNNFEPAKKVVNTFRSLANGTTLIVNYEQPVCTGGDLKLTATAIKNGTYSWSGPKGFTSKEQNPILSNVSLSDSGKYSVIVSVPNEPLKSNTVTVKIFNAPKNISLTPVLVSKCPRQYMLSSIGDSLKSFQWFINGKQILGARDFSYLPVSTGVYSVIGLNAASCSINSVPIYLNLDPDSIPCNRSVTITFNKPICTGSELKLTATPIVNGKYFWTGPNGFTSIEQNPTISNVALSDSGLYTLKVQSSRDTLFTSIHIPVYKTPSRLTITSLLINKCAKVYKFLTEGDSIKKYQWFLNSSLLSGVEESSIYPGITGIYSVKGSNAAGCSIISNEIYVNVDQDSIPCNSKVTLDFNDPICTGGELKLTATPITNGKYFWSGPNGFSSKVQNPIIYNVSLANSGKYILNVISPRDTLFASIQVRIFRSPLKITLYSSLTNICSREYKAFTEGDSINNYQWFLNAKKIIGAEDSSLVPSITGVYSVNGYNSVGCSISSAPVYINVDPDSIPLLTRLRKPSRLRAPLAQNYQWFIDNYMVAGNNAQELPLLFNGDYRVKLKDSKGCEKFSPGFTVFEDDLPELRTDMVMANGTLNIDSEISGISIVPQPANNEAHISWKSSKRGSISIEISDAKGKQVYNEIKEKSNELFYNNLSLENWSSGIYHVRLTCDGKTITGKLVITK